MTTASPTTRAEAPVSRPSWLRRHLRGVIGAALVVASVLWIVASAGFGGNSLAAVLPVLTMAGVYSIAAAGLNVQYTLGGLMNFGYVGFLACGSYITVILIPHRMGEGSVESGGYAPLWLAMIIAIIVTGALGALFALPTLRVRGDYFAIIMIAAAELIRVALREGSEITGGVYGVLGYSTVIQDIRPPFIDDLADDLDVTAYQLWLFVLIWLGVALAVLLTTYLLRSRWAILARAVRDDESGVRSLGKNPAAVKLQSLVIGGGIGGLAGVFFAFQLSQVNPDIFVADITFFVFTVMIIGGAGTALGPIVGGVVFWVLYTQAGNLINDLFGSSTAAASARYVLVGVLLTALFVFRPQGVLGTRAKALASGGAV
ncbi:branched-chain amino acid ABC transporter permease [Microbacterium betulae]|uniref:Branched-chain amino acid ABC transporter permease n=1 Tax=Microbacterium betulae TaxID=2981139 RepID=A0AA97I4F7_9MICO|nr:branched-chain amino acid ABC transporter permease [Microbacterium sp. AB]WOF22561.1 branched-chain amino acid ABC transporter permease [Microbacterium sp. AB]